MLCLVVYFTILHIYPLPYIIRMLISQRDTILYHQSIHRIVTFFSHFYLKSNKIAIKTQLYIIYFIIILHPIFILHFLPIIIIINPTIPSHTPTLHHYSHSLYSPYPHPPYSVTATSVLITGFPPPSQYTPLNHHFFIPQIPPFFDRGVSGERIGGGWGKGRWGRGCEKGLDGKMGMRWENRSCEGWW